MKNLEKHLAPFLLVLIVISYTLLAFLSEGSYGEADDMTHFRYARYAFRYPHLFLHHWGKPFFTALSAPFAQLGFTGMRIFNVLAGSAAAYLSYRMARELGLKDALLAMVLLVTAPIYSVMMLSGMTEVLCSLVLIGSIYLFYRERYIWSALLLSFIPFVRTETFIFLPLFFIALSWKRQWKALPWLFFGFLFYSVVGYFYYRDLLWVIHEMPYGGNENPIYGSGKLLHYVNAAARTFGLPLSLLIFLGLLGWVLHPFLTARKKPGPDWYMQMLVVYLPFLLYFAAHSWVWWRGTGNSLGLVRVMAAIMPSAVLLGLSGWNLLMDRLRLGRRWRILLGLGLGLFLLTLPSRIYDIPVPLDREARVVKDAAQWLKDQGETRNKIYYYDPWLCHFLQIDPFDQESVRAKVNNPEIPEKNIREGDLVVWDAHFGPNEGRLPLERLLDNRAFHLIHLLRPEESFRTLGDHSYEICIFRRVKKGSGPDNRAIYQQLVNKSAS